MCSPLPARAHIWKIAVSSPTVNPEPPYSKDYLSRQQVIADSNGNQAGDGPLSGGKEARFRANPKTTNTVLKIQPQRLVLRMSSWRKTVLPKSSSLSTPQSSSVYSM